MPEVAGEPRDPITVSEKHTKRLVLAIDDDPNIHDFLGAIVRQQKFEYSSAGTGQKAIAMAKKRVPDLVFMDVVLPDTEGFQLCQVMRDEIEGFDATVVFLSVKHSLTDIQMAMAMGGNDYLAKPFTPDQIIARLNKWLGGAE